MEPPWLWKALYFHDHQPPLLGLPWAQLLPSEATAQPPWPRWPGWPWPWTSAESELLGNRGVLEKFPLENQMRSHLELGWSTHDVRTDLWIYDGFFHFCAGEPFRWPWYMRTFAYETKPRGDATFGQHDPCVSCKHQPERDKEGRKHFKMLHSCWETNDACKTRFLGYIFPQNSAEREDFSSCLLGRRATYQL